MITSTEREAAVPIHEADLTEGHPKTHPSFVTPWSLHVFPDREVTKRVAQVDAASMRAVASGIERVTRIGE